MGAAGITAYGGYIAPSRIEREAIFKANAWAAPHLKGLAKGARAAAGWDEDSVTMAVEAARDMVSGESEGTINRLFLASTTLPFADRQNAGLVAAALDLPETLSTLDMGGSLRAGTGALKSALETKIEDAPERAALVIAADRRRTKPGSPQEMIYGDAAAAVMVGGGEPVARYLGGLSLSRDLVDHYRAAAADYDYALEDRWVRDEGYLKIVPEVVGKLLEHTGVGADSIDHFILPCPTPRLPEKVAVVIGIPPEAAQDNMADGCGFTGTAHPLLMLARCLETAKPGARLLVIGFGQGADALLFEVTEAITDFRPARGIVAQCRGGKPDSNYMRFLSNGGQIAMDWGMRAERDNRTALSTLYRKRDIITGFEGGKCSQCGTVQYPRTHICVNPNCGAADTQAPYSFANAIGRIKSFTEDWQAFCPDPPLKYGNISFDGGGNIFMEMADFAVGEAKVGDPVRMVFRIKDFDRSRNFRRYFWKAAPVSAGEG